MMIPTTPLNFPTEDAYPSPHDAVECSFVGKGLFVNGDIMGAAPLHIDGAIKGQIHLLGQQVTVGHDGQVAADVSAREVVVFGELRGDIAAADLADIRVSGNVIGNVSGARVSLESGAYFKGSVTIRKSDNGPGRVIEGPSFESVDSRAESAAASSSSGAVLSSVGRGLFLKGEVTGSADLLIEGKAEGSIKLPGRRVTIGRNGQVTANISASEIVVLGRVQGNLMASERLDLRSEGSVTGDLTGARIMIEDGAYFKGSVDIRNSEEKQTTEWTPPKPAPKSPEWRRWNGSAMQDQPSYSDQ
jgi:Integral membrane protein CcmA involved in cell shape determination